MGLLRWDVIYGMGLLRWDIIYVCVVNDAVLPRARFFCIFVLHCHLFVVVCITVYVIGHLDSNLSP